MVVHNRDSDSTLSLRMVFKLSEEIDPSEQYKILTFLMKNVDDQDENLMLVLVYRRKGVILEIVGIGDGENRILLYIKPKEKEEIL